MFDPHAAREILGKIDDPSALLEALFMHSPIPVQLYSAEGRSLFVNEAFYSLFGAVPPSDYCVLHDEVAVRRGLDSLFREAFGGKVTRIPASWYDRRELEHATLTEAQRIAIETFCVPILGAEREVRYVVFLFREVTGEQQLVLEKREAVRKLEEANLLIERLISGSRSVIYAKDLDGRLLFANEQYGRVVGCNTRELIGKLVEELHPPDVAAQFRANDQMAMDGRSLLEAEETLQHPDGSTHLYFSQKFPLLDSKGKAYGVCGISTDITDVRRLEKELNHARRMESLGLLAGGVAHDFNNLLGMILLHTEALALRCEGRDEARDLDQIRTSVERAATLVRQLLAFGRRLPMQPQPVDLNTVVGDFTYMISKLTGEGAKLEVYRSSEPCVAFVDPARVEQVLLNLCMNARDAIDYNGTIRIRTGREAVKATVGMQLACSPGEYAVIEVEDDGQGMSEEVLERAFEPFFTTKEEMRGTGLGLSTVFGIVRESRGGLKLCSVVGRGCSVKVFLPAPSLHDIPGKTVGADAKGTTEANLVTVLLVEDEALLREITARQLRMEGFTVFEANGAAEARDRLRENPQVSVLVCDVIMPGKTGPALVKDLETEGMLRNRGVLFITGYSSEELEWKGFDPASMHLLEKPFTTQGLMEMIGVALKERVP